MKKTVLKLSFFFTTVLLTTACSDYLSEVPDNRTEINNTEKVKELLTLAYPLSSPYFFLETMSDNARDRGTLSSTTQLSERLFKWEVPVDEEQDTPTDYWNACYEAIAQANYALEAIEEQSDGSQTWNELKGEALLCRAYAHFMLVNIFSKSYNPTTSKSDLGIPYVMEAERELLKDYSRNTMEETFKFLEADILEGLDLVGDDYENPKYHFTSTAGHALATRFYLFKGEWDNTIKYANLALGNNIENKIRDNVYNSSLGIEPELRRYASPEEPANILVQDVLSTYNFWRDTRGRFGLDPTLINELFYTPNLYNKQWAFNMYGRAPQQFPAKLDEYFSYTNISAGIGWVYTPIVLFSYDEMILARAEAFAMKEDFGSSLIDINTFLPKKTVEYNSSTDEVDEDDIVSQFPFILDEFTPFYVDQMTEKQVSFVKAIANMRRVQFFGEGLRWFDIKRFKLEITHDVFNDSSFTLAKDDNRKAVQIPNNATSLGIQPNPR